MRPLPFFAVLVLILLPLSVSRPLKDGYSDDDGVSSFDPLIRFKGIPSQSAETCEQMYGFLPCSSSMSGHLFLILVYEYLLFHAESYVASGGERVFKILGPGVFGASAFQVIGALPEALIMLASGLSSSAEIAQECVVTGVGLLAGSSIFLLTLLWGTCVILGSQHFSEHMKLELPQNKKPNHLERLLLSLWPGYGIVTDLGTSYTARIMLISLIPLMIMQFPKIFGLSHVGERITLMITLVVSVMFIASNFFYQFFHPWIQRRRLFYIKHEHLVIDILKHLQNKTMGKLLTENGSPNVSTIRRLFEEKDHDGDKVISFPELKEFLNEIKFRKLQADEDDNTAEIMKEFDVNNDQKITMDEFVDGMMKWLDEIKQGLNKRYHSVKSLKGLYEVLKPWIQKKREEREMMSHLIPEILEHLQNSAYGELLKEDGSPDVLAIKRLFNSIDLDKDDCISLFELKELLTNIQFGIIPYDADVAASKIMAELDVNEDQLISEDEFVSGLSKWLDKTYNPNYKMEETEEDDSYQKTWEQTDKLIEDKFTDKSAFAWTKAVGLIVVGIVILGLLAEPLVKSVRNFSVAADVPSFYVAFVFVPLATNARITISAISEVRKKKFHTTSLILSEIYGTVFMNNILGLAVLVCLIYFQGLSWTFSSEVLVVLLVTAITGCMSSFNLVFPVWISTLAYFLYPMSLVLVYILGEFDWFAKKLVKS